MQRQFEFSNVLYGDRRVRGVIMKCAGCGKTSGEPINHFRGMGDDDNKVAATVERKFTDKGWAIGKRSADDLCPSCVNNRTGIIHDSNVKANKRTLQAKANAIFAPKPPEPSPMPIANGHTNGTIEPLPVMSRDDRRIIFECVNEHWDGAAYVPVWTDKRVAEHLGCPLPWVVAVRKEFFGEIGSNPDFDAKLAEATKIVAEFRDMHKAANDALQAINSQHKRINELYAKITAALPMIDKLERNTAEIKKAVAP